MLSASKSASRLNTARGYWLIANATTFLMTLTLLVGWGLIFGTIPFYIGYLLIACCCVVPAATYLYGFFLPYGPDRDAGLLLTAIGWFCASIVFFIQHSALQAQLSALANTPGATLNGGLESSALLFIILAVAFMAGGATLSLSAWNRDRAGLRNAYHDEELRQNARRSGL